MIHANEKGRFGRFGGCYVPELLVAPITALTKAFETAQKDTAFQEQLHDLLTNYVGRPTPLTEIQQFSSAVNGPRIFLKREDLLHTGAHKINNSLGQCLLAKTMGKNRIIAETGAGQHGVATATAAALLGLDCTIYMGKVDAERQRPNVEKIQLLGAQVKLVCSGSQTLKDAINETMRDWAESYETTYYCIGSALGPHPYPSMVAYFQSIIGKEAREQLLKRCGCLPKAVIACVGGGSNAIGIFSAFMDDKAVQLIGIEAGGSSNTLGKHAARFLENQIGVLHGNETYVLQDSQGQIAATHSISAGLDYPAISPQHAYLHQSERAHYCYARDEQALKAFKLLSRTEGIIPALESSHALAYFFMKESQQFSNKDCVIVNLSGRGDKDLPDLFEKRLLVEE